MKQEVINIPWWSRCSYEVRIFLRRMNWSTLRTVGNSRLVSLTIFIPIIGYLVILSDNFISYLRPAEEFLGVTTSGLTLIEKLKLVYLGLVFLSFGQAIFWIRCPKLIKNYGSFLEYIEREKRHIVGSDKEHVNAHNREQFLRSCVLEMEILYEGQDTEEISFYKEIAESLQNNENKHQYVNHGRKLEDLMETRYEAHDSMYRKPLYACMILYSIGFLLLFIPAFETFTRVLMTF